MAEDSPNVLRPRPLRPNLPSSYSSDLASPLRDRLDAAKLSSERDEKGDYLTGTRSILNLTSSTLFGIYDPSTPDESLTPGMQTPGLQASIDDQQPPIIGAFERSKPPPLDVPHHRRSFLATTMRTVILFVAGAAYGIFISQLHDSQRIAPVQIEVVETWSWPYLVGWGVAGVSLGALLPWIDSVLEGVLGGRKDELQQPPFAKSGSTRQEEARPGSSSGKAGIEANWNPLVRAITAFIGVAFAIRRLPWQSINQVSLTVALVNPVLWYLLDRSKAGFLLSTTVGIAGTLIALGTNPDIVPSPPTPSPGANIANVAHDNSFLFDGKLSVERFGVGTWIASVLFCSCLCFGNIGRRLLSQPSLKNSGSS